MIIVMEGVDGAGKTTLAERISGRLNVPIFKPPGTPLMGMPVAVSQAEDAITIALLEQLRDPDILMDRFFPSEYVYGKAYDREVNTKLIWDLDERLSKLNAICFVFAYEYDMDAAKRADPPVMPLAGTINKLYKEYAAGSKCHWVRVNALKTVDENMEWVMAHIARQRDSRDTTYMSMAYAAAKRSTCLARRNGAVLLSKDWQVIATGYNGAPVGWPHPTSCERLRSGAKSGEMLDSCVDVHSEENCLVQAALNHSSPEGGVMFTIASPCHRCARMLINAKISEVVYEVEYGDERGRAMLRSAGIKLRRIGE